MFEFLCRIISQLNLWSKCCWELKEMHLSISVWKNLWSISVLRVNLSSPLNKKGIKKLRRIILGSKSSLPRGKCLTKIKILMAMILTQKCINPRLSIKTRPGKVPDHQKNWNTHNLLFKTARLRLILWIKSIKLLFLFLFPLIREIKIKSRLLWKKCNKNMFSKPNRFLQRLEIVISTTKCWRKTKKKFNKEENVVWLWHWQMKSLSISWIGKRTRKVDRKGKISFLKQNQYHGTVHWTCLRRKSKNKFLEMKK